MNRKKKYKHESTVKKIRRFYPILLLPMVLTSDLKYCFHKRKKKIQSHKLV